MSELTQSPQWLDLTAIAEMTQCSYSVLRRYAEQPEVQRTLGAANLPGTKGVRWPLASLETWRNIAEGHLSGKLTPKTAAAFLSDKAAIVVLPQSGNELTQIGNDAVTGIARIVELLERHNAVNPPADKLLSMKQAHEETGLPYAILRGLRVKVGNRLYCRRSDCLRVIQEAK
jgi:hypothetical protein